MEDTGCLSKAMQGVEGEGEPRSLAATWHVHDLSDTDNDPIDEVFQEERSDSAEETLLLVTSSSPSQTVLPYDMSCCDERVSHLAHGVSDQRTSVVGMHSLVQQGGNAVDDGLESVSLSAASLRRVSSRAQATNIPTLVPRTIHVGVIVGVVLATLLVLVAAAACFLVRRRRHPPRRESSVAEKPRVQPKTCSCMRHVFSKC